MNEDQLAALMTTMLDAKAVMEESDMAVQVVHGPGITAVVAIGEASEALLEIVKAWSGEDG
jgi:hypothetical protein